MESQRSGVSRTGVFHRSIGARSRFRSDEGKKKEAETGAARPRTGTGKTDSLLPARGKTDHELEREGTWKHLGRGRGAQKKVTMNRKGACQ